MYHILGYFYGIVLLRLQNIFSFIIQNILGKDLTFTGRTRIWDNAIEFIKARFIIGYGKETGAVIASKLGDIKFTHAHCN